MEKGTKRILGTLTVMGLGYLVFKATQKVGDANMFVNQMQISIKPSANPIKVSGVSSIKLSVDVFIFNPSKFSVTVAKPTIVLKYGEKTLAVSEGSNQQITVLPQKTTAIRNITFDISLLSNFSTWIEIGQEIGKNTSSATAFNEIATILAANASKVLGLLKCDLSTYWGDTPITYTTTLV